MSYGVMAAGRTMVPLEAQDPHDRLALVHREAGASITVTDRAHLATAEAALDCPIVVLEDALAAPAASSELRDPDPHDLAMVLFTSGSTGTPKGVMRDHTTILRHGTAAAFVNGIVPGDAISFTGSFAFIGAYTALVRDAARRRDGLHARLPHRGTPDPPRLGRRQPHRGDAARAVGAARAHRCRRGERTHPGWTASAWSRSAGRRSSGATSSAPGRSSGRTRCSAIDTERARPRP